MEDLRGKRMLDHLLSMPQFVPYQPKIMLDMPDFGRTENLIRNRLKRAEVFEISNIADYFWEGTAQESWDVYKDFPCVMPPFEDMWLEYRAPREVNSDVVGRHAWDGAFGRCGIFIHTAPAPTDIPVNIIGASHISMCSMFFQSVKGRSAGQICGPVGSIAYGINHEGAPVSHSGSKTIMVIPRHTGDYEPSRDFYNGILHAPLYPALLALTFLNCKNVAISQNKAEEKLDRVHRKAHGRQLVTFKTLEIEPIKKLFRAHAGPSETLQRALHMCRGHFKDYREGGLFGRHKGLYWWGPQVRGSIECGSVIKDYSMAAPVN